MKTLIIRMRDGATGSPIMQAFIRRAPVPRGWKRRFRPVGRHPIRTVAGGQFTFVAQADDVMARSIVWDGWGTWEKSTAECLSRHLSSAQTFWDIGAYVGAYSLLACAVNPDIRVIAFEPVPQHAAWLRENLEVNGWTDRVEVIEAAATDVDGHVEFTITSGDRTASQVGTARDGKRIEVPAIRLCTVEPKPDVIKIDVEGHEVAALSTLAGHLESAHPIIVAECLDNAALRRLFDFLEPLGYAIEHLSVDGPVVIDRHFEVPPVHANFVASAAGRT